MDNQTKPAPTAENHPIEITNIVGATGVCPVEGCNELHGTLQVYFEAPLGTIHPSKDPEFLPYIKAKLAEDGYSGTENIEIHKDDLQSTAYVSLDMGTEFAVSWLTTIEKYSKK